MRTRVRLEGMLYEKEVWGLGLVDPEATKTNLLCKWIVKALEPRESNLQLTLRYRLAQFNPKRGRKWGVNLECFTSKNHKGFLVSKVWGHINKAWKSMVKGTYQLPPCTLSGLLHSNVWWSVGLDLIDNVSLTLDLMNYTVKVSKEWMTFGIVSSMPFIPRKWLLASFTWGKWIARTRIGSP